MQRATGQRYQPRALQRASGSMSFLGRRPYRRCVFFVGIMAIPYFPQFHAGTAQFISDQRGRVLVQFHLNYIIFQNGVARTTFNPNAPLALPPPQQAFRVESLNAAGLWAPLAFNANLRAYVMTWGSDFRIMIGQGIWELWRPQLQMSRQAFGPGNHNEPYP